MKYLLQFTLIGLLALAGELLQQLLPIPVPAGIYGLLFLFLGLWSGRIKADQVEECADWLLEVMPVMFVPATVGLMTKWEDIKYSLPGLCIASILSTAIVMAVTGLTSQLVIRAKKNREKGTGYGENP